LNSYFSVKKTFKIFADHQENLRKKREFRKEAKLYGVTYNNNRRTLYRKLSTIDSQGRVVGRRNKDTL